MGLADRKTCSYAIPAHSAPARDRVRFVTRVEARRVRVGVDPRCAASRPSASSVSTASAAAATSRSASSCARSRRARSRRAAAGRRAPAAPRRRAGAGSRACRDAGRRSGDRCARRDRRRCAPAAVRVGRSLSSWTTSTAVGLELEEPHRVAHRAARVVHVRLGLQQRDLVAVDADLGELAVELAAPRAVVPAGELVDDHPADVVPVARVLATGVAEARDEQVERGAVAPRPQRIGQLSSVRARRRRRRSRRLPRPRRAPRPRRHPLALDAAFDGLGLFLDARLRDRGQQDRLRDRREA